MHSFLLNFRPGYYLYNAFFLIFLITISGLNIFSINSTTPHFRLQSTYTLLLTSVSFKWVINRELPTLSYMTLLDKYSIACIFFLCSLCVWHALIGYFKFDTSFDFWSLVIFSLIFSLIHLVLTIKFVQTFAKSKSLVAKEENTLKEK